MVEMAQQAQRNDYTTITIYDDATFAAGTARPPQVFSTCVHYTIFKAGP
jgi:hypothetical protein